MPTPQHDMLFVKAAITAKNLSFFFDVVFCIHEICLHNFLTDLTFWILLKVADSWLSEQPGKRPINGNRLLTTTGFPDQ